MQHSPRRDAKLAAVALLALSSIYATTEGAEAQPRRYAAAQPRGHTEVRSGRYINGHLSLCGAPNIPVKIYAADYYYARPLVCDGGRVNGDLNPDFQLRKGG
jgi:hypothetical protein